MQAIGRQLLALLALSAVGCGAEMDGSRPITNGSPDADLDGPDGSARPGRPDAGYDAAPDAAVPCTEGNDQVSDPDTFHCYILFTSNANWATARSLCDDLGPSAHLATITDPAEFTIIQAMLGGREAWIGANDIAAENNFVWDSGEPFVYTNWRGGEPSNSDGNEDCAVVQGNQAGRWDDRPCGLSYNYICERD